MSKFSEHASNFPGFSLAVWELIHRPAGNEAGRISHCVVAARSTVLSPRRAKEIPRVLGQKRWQFHFHFFRSLIKLQKEKGIRQGKSPLIRNYEESLIFLRTSSCSCYQLLPTKMPLFRLLAAPRSTRSVKIHAIPITTIFQRNCCYILIAGLHKALFTIFS